jgi:hypothetical protein
MLYDINAKKRTRIYKNEPCLPGFLNPGERPEPGAARELWQSFMVERAKLIEKHRAEAACVEASWAVRSDAATLRLENCGSLWFERIEAEGYSWAPMRCRSRWCPSCVNVWRIPVIQAFTAALSPDQRVTLVTFTGGKSVPPGQLKERMQQMSQALRRWKRKALAEGVEGGVYAWEVTQGEEGRLHAHLHISLVYSADCSWALADDAAVRAGIFNGDLSPALIWLALSWSSAIEREAPALYAALLSWRSLLPSMDRERGLRFGPVEARRGAVCDIGGRWPDPKKKRVRFERLGSGDPAENLEQTIKYAVKRGGDISSQGWCEIFNAFRGRRRIQGFGCLYGIKPAEEKTEEVKASELTGAAAWVGNHKQGNLSDLAKAFVWDSTISHVKASGNKEITWFFCNLEGVE